MSPLDSKVSFGYHVTVGNKVSFGYYVTLGNGVSFGYIDTFGNKRIPFNTTDLSSTLLISDPKFAASVIEHLIRGNLLN